MLCRRGLSTGTSERKKGKRCGCNRAGGDGASNWRLVHVGSGVVAVNPVNPRLAASGVSRLLVVGAATRGGKLFGDLGVLSLPCRVRGPARYRVAYDRSRVRCL